MPVSSTFVSEISIEKLKIHKLPDVKFKEILLKKQVGQFVLITIKLLIPIRVSKNSLLIARYNYCTNL